MIPKTKEEYDNLMGLNTQDCGSVKTMRKLVNDKLKMKGYKPLKGYKSMKQLIAIKLSTG